MNQEDKGFISSCYSSVKHNAYLIYVCIVFKHMFWLKMLQFEIMTLGITSNSSFLDKSLLKRR